MRLWLTVGSLAAAVAALLTSLVFLPSPFSVSFFSDALDHDYRRPYRPALVALLNWLAGPPSSYCRTLLANPHSPVSLSLEPIHLMQVARERAGVGPEVGWGGDDCGSDSNADKGGDCQGEVILLRALQMLIESAEREAQLSFFGSILLRERLLGLLTNRLKVEAWVLHFPEISREHIDAVFITGLARSGTTMLHRLLAADDETFQHLPAWQCLNIAPPLTEAAARGEEHQGGGFEEDHGRRAIAGWSALAFEWLAPSFAAVHPMSTEAAEEEVLLMDLTLHSMVAESTLHVPSYSRWLETQDQTVAYRYLKRTLQLAQWFRRRNSSGGGGGSGGAGKIWILKTPDHLQYLDALSAVFPTAPVIVLHRSPLKTLPSFSSLVAHAHGMHSDNVDPVAIGAQWLAKQARCVKRAHTYRFVPFVRNVDASDPTSPLRRFLDVDYQEAVADPSVVLHAIYDFLRLPLPAATELALLKQLADTRKEQGVVGKHRYALTSFGLTEDRVREEFEEYLSWRDFV